MKLPKEAIRDFQEAYLKDFGEAISEAEAAELGSRLMQLMAAVYRPLHQKYSNNHSDKV